MYLVLLRKFWWVIPVVVAVVALWWLRFEVGDLRKVVADRDATVATLTERLDAEHRLALAQQELASQMEVLWRDAVKETNDETQAKLATVAADRTSLARRLRDAETRTCPDPSRNVSATAGDRPRDERSAGVAGREGEARERDDALDGYDRACRRDAARLAFWIETWRRLKAAER